MQAAGGWSCFCSALRACMHGPQPALAACWSQPSSAALLLLPCSCVTCPAHGTKFDLSTGQP